MALGFLCSDEDDLLLGCLLRMLRLGVSTVATSARDAVGLDVIAQHCGALLDIRLKSPARSRDDWSLAWSDRCKCKLCGMLGSFLGDSEQTLFNWPLAQQGRRHVHGQLDTHELPVSHVLCGGRLQPVLDRRWGGYRFDSLIAGKHLRATDQ